MGPNKKDDKRKKPQDKSKKHNIRNFNPDKSTFNYVRLSYNEYL